MCRPYLVRGLVVTVRPGVRVPVQEYARRVLCAGVRVRDLAVSGQHGQSEQHDQHPRDDDGGRRVPFGAHVDGSDRMDDGQEPANRRGCFRFKLLSFMALAYFSRHTLPSLNVPTISICKTCFSFFFFCHALNAHTALSNKTACVKP